MSINIKYKKRINKQTGFYLEYSSRVFPTVPLYLYDQFFSKHIERQRRLCLDGQHVLCVAVVIRVALEACAQAGGAVAVTTVGALTYVLVGGLVSCLSDENGLVAVHASGLVEGQVEGILYRRPRSVSSGHLGSGDCSRRCGCSS